MFNENDNSPIKKFNEPLAVLACVLPIPLVFACFALSPTAIAQTCQEGCLTNENTVLGDNALISLTIGVANTATGFEALQSDTIGGYNTATGYQALWLNTTGGFNTATGFGALGWNTTGSNNTAAGFGALNDNTTGLSNTAVGGDAFYSNMTGHNNTATGAGALQSNTTGSNNTATGAGALQSNRSGSYNIAVGVNAGFNLTRGIDNIDIGHPGVAGESKAIRIGKQGTQTATYIAGISGATVPTGVAVIADTNGHLGTTTSSARFKDAIKPMDKASEAILALKPVTFRYKKELDPECIRQFGLVAEDVEKVNPDLVARDEQGKPYTVRYEAVKAMLLNEFLKEHRKVEEQAKALRADENEIAQVKSDLAEQRKNFESRIAQQEKQIGTLSAALQKVTARLESSPTTAKVVADN